MQDSGELYSGQCQCGNIRYRINGEPLALYACHCRDCQQQSASAFGMSMRVAFNDFELISGGLKFWSTTADDGGAKICAFCPECGTRIYHASDNPTEPIGIKAGSLDNLSQFSPVAHIWTKSAQQWLEIGNTETLVYSGQPDDFVDIYKAWAGRNRQ